MVPASGLPEVAGIDVGKEVVASGVLGIEKGEPEGQRGQAAVVSR